MSESPIFCCESVKPYRPAHLLHEAKFTSFMEWAKFPRTSERATVEGGKVDLVELKPPYVIQLVRQINYGAIEAKRFFVPVGVQDGQVQDFSEVSEEDLIRANFQKLNSSVSISTPPAAAGMDPLANQFHDDSYKNFKCEGHNKFLEVNVYQKDPANKHHWRVNIARPGSEIDLK